MHILVLGIGQPLRGDDALGLEVVRAWCEKYPDTARLVKTELSEIPGLGLVDLLGGMDSAVLVDAVHDDQPPGTIHDLDINDLDSFDQGSRSAHGWGVAETLKLARSLYPDLINLKLSVIGISIKNLEMGEEVSLEVRSAIPSACLRLDKKVRSLLAG